MMSSAFHRTWKPRVKVDLARAADAAGSQSAAPVVTATRWLICADCIDVARTFAASCERAGIEYALVSRSAETGLRAREYQASASSDVERVFDRLANERFEPAVVVFIAAESAPSLEAIDTVRADCLAATAWLRKLGNARHAARLWVVTRGAQPVADTSPTQFAQAGLWGWGRVASLEKPELFGGLVDAEPDNWPGQRGPGCHRVAGVGRSIRHPARAAVRAAVGAGGFSRICILAMRPEPTVSGYRVDGRPRPAPGPVARGPRSPPPHAGRPARFVRAGC